MNWIELHKNYPLAYKHMEDDFNCLYTIELEPNIDKFTVIYNKKGDSRIIGGKIKHPLKRDLYDFFDYNNVFISTAPRQADIFNGSDYICIKGATRSNVEEKAFTKAFEILNDRLK